MFGSLGWQELLIVLVIVIVIFGAGKLPEIGSGLGKGIRGFKEESGMGDKDKAEAAIEEGTSRTSSTLTSTARDTRESVARERDAATDVRDRGVRADDI